MVCVGSAGSSLAAELHERNKSLNIALLPAENSEPYSTSVNRASWGATVATLLSLQLGWGLWLMPHDFARWDSVEGATQTDCWLLVEREGRGQDTPLHAG